jgi:hypothetical protein
MSQRALARCRRSLGALSLAWLTAVLGCKSKVDEPSGATPTLVSATTVGLSSPVSSGASTARPSAADPCVSACAHSRELRCSGAEQCETTCARLRDSDPCGAEMRAALGCFAAEPATSWECGDDGMAAIREGFCVAAQQRVVDCLSASAAD